VILAPYLKIRSGEDRIKRAIYQFEGFNFLQRIEWGVEELYSCLIKWFLGRAWPRIIFLTHYSWQIDNSTFFPRKTLSTSIISRLTFMRPVSCLWKNLFSNFSIFIEISLSKYFHKKILTKKSHGGSFGGDMGQSPLRFKKPKPLMATSSISCYECTNRMYSIFFIFIYTSNSTCLVSVRPVACELLAYCVIS